MTRQDNNPHPPIQVRLGLGTKEANPKAGVFCSINRWFPSDDKPMTRHISLGLRYYLFCSTMRSKNKAEE